MDVERVATFFAVLLLGGGAGSLLAAAMPATRPHLIDAALPTAAVIAVGATAGSLYFSEGAHFVPCELCWFQRIAMYPQAIILPLAAATADRRAFRYVLPLALIGLATSIYHVQLQLFPEQSSFCDITNPCSGRWVEAFGWMTIPQMAGAAFAIVILLATLSLFSDATIGTEPAADEVVPVHHEAKEQS